MGDEKMSDNTNISYFITVRHNGNAWESMLMIDRNDCIYDAETDNFVCSSTDSALDALNKTIKIIQDNEK
jgi:hypothetical protein